MSGKFVGVWKLVSCESKDRNGVVSHPFGTNPVGRITYDEVGRMSAQLMNPDRPWVGGSPQGGSALAFRDTPPDDLRRVLGTFTAYFGTFEVDESSHTVIHHVQAALIPSWVGTDLRRTYEFTGNQLVLTASSEQRVTRLVWHRDSG